MAREAQDPVRAWRRRHRVSLRELAALTGIAQSELSRFERGLRTLPALALVRVSKATGVPIEQIVGETTDVPADKPSH